MDSRIEGIFFLLLCITWELTLEDALNIFLRIEYTIGIFKFLQENYHRNRMVTSIWIDRSKDFSRQERSNQVQGNSANGNAARVPFGGYLKCHSRAQASIKGHRSLCGETTVLFVGLVVRKINLPKIRTPPRSSRSCISLKRFKLLKPWNHVSPLSGEPRLTFHVTETGNFHRASIISELNFKLLHTRWCHFRFERVSNLIFLRHIYISMVIPA